MIKNKKLEPKASAQNIPQPNPNPINNSRKFKKDIILGREQRLRIIFLQKVKFFGALLIIPTISLGFVLFLAFKVNFENQNGAFGRDIKDASILQKPAFENQNDSSSQNSSDSSFSQELPIEIAKEASIEIKAIDLEFKLGSAFTSLQMALDKYEIQTTSQEILDEVTINTPMEKKILEDRIIWGDPDKGFVGDPDGVLVGSRKSQKSLRFATGWGINNGPIVKAAQKFRPNSQEIDNANLEEIKIAISEGFVVLVWYVPGDALPEDLEILTSEEKKVILTQTQVAILKAYSQDEKGETTYKLQDPASGEVVLNEADFLKQWSKAFNDVVIVK